MNVYVVFCCLLFTVVCFSSIAGLAPLASYSFVWITSMLFTLRAEQSSFKFVPNKFSQQPQKSNQKKAAQFVCPAGSWILWYCQRARLDAPSRRTRLNSPSLANLLYQYQRIQQTKEGVKNNKRKNQTKPNQTKPNQTKPNQTKQRKQRLILIHIVRVLHYFWFCPLQQAIETPFLSWAFCASCLSVFCEFWRSMITTVAQWAPRVLYGA